MQIATVVIFAALLTSTAALHADPAAESPEMLRTPATPKLLFVLEYDSFVDWEAVTLEQGVTDGVLAWMMQLQDRLTLTTQTPLGEKLLVCLSAMILYKSMLPLQFSRCLHIIGSAWQCGCWFHSIDAPQLQPCVARFEAKCF